jgi:predicted esterase
MTDVIWTASRCPSTKIVLSGYSQGAQLVHNAAVRTSAANAARVAAGTFDDDLSSHLNFPNTRSCCLWRP